MSSNDGGGEGGEEFTDEPPDLTAERAAEIVRNLTNNLGADAVADFLQRDDTSGMAAFEARDLRAAVAQLGEQRAAEIAGVRATAPEEPVTRELGQGDFRQFEPEGGGPTRGAGGTDRVEQLREQVNRIANIEGSAAIERFLDPDEVAPIGMQESQVLSEAVDVLGAEGVRRAAGILDSFDTDFGGLEPEEQPRRRERSGQGTLTGGGLAADEGARTEPPAEGTKRLSEFGERRSSDDVGEGDDSGNG